MDWLGITLLFLYNVVIVVDIILSQNWNKKWINELRDKIAEYDAAIQDLCHMQEWPAMGYYYVMQGNDGYAKVFAKYLSTSVCIKHYCSNDEAYNKLCAEELVEKLNERI